VRLGDFAVDPEVVTNTRRAAALLAEAGAVVDEVELPWRRTELFAAFRSHFGAIFGAAVGHDLIDNAHLLTPYARRFAEEMQSTPLSFLDGMELEGRLWQPLGALFERYDALLCPTMATRGYPVGEDYTEHTLTVDGVEVEHYLLGAMTTPFNMFSRCPVLSVPSGLADNGVPTGLQIVGRTYDDPTVFRIGYAVEAARGGFPLAPL
jgi:aspartyl-tRNA(Asn)/glutamyl-tRNA(Gln) amidotransferase subunit A